MACNSCRRPGSSQKVNHTLVSPKSRRSTCSRAKYHWQVFEFVPNGTAQNASSQEGRATALFVLVDTRASAGKKPNVELHQLEANATTKAITVRATDASLFRSYDRILRKKGLFLDSPAQQGKPGKGEKKRKRGKQLFPSFLFSLQQGKPGAILGEQRAERGVGRETAAEGGGEIEEGRKRALFLPFSFLR